MPTKMFVIRVITEVPTVINPTLLCRLFEVYGLLQVASRIALKRYLYFSRKFNEIVLQMILSNALYHIKLHYFHGFWYY